MKALFSERGRCSKKVCGMGLASYSTWKWSVVLGYDIFADKKG